ncbi:ArsR/SmtB family transcription factor [Mycoplasmopsis alligatoris]|uniref:HTH arsR-type domain-containing protein n=1 Tax=Mycoplasmopsis alligatoris A21JP2 TaxID=747682 RepID=D4XV12_9BACT|nr:helix-turn-helix transcriptional regulator [Mycoplasmopsis alligatoris]EFF41797.1 conserved hypothetical protein [Mycoplasmopsis alligatoris A21JP2]
MELTKFFKLCSSKVKLLIIVHLYSCDDNECDVQTLVDLFQEKQSNISKHFMDLRKLKVVEKKKDAKRVFYKLTKKFKQQYSAYLDIISLDHCFKDYACFCSSIKYENSKCAHDCCDE